MISYQPGLIGAIIERKLDNAASNSEAHAASHTAVVVRASQLFAAESLDANGKVEHV